MANLNVFKALAEDVSILTDGIFGFYKNTKDLFLSLF